MTTTHRPWQHRLLPLLLVALAGLLVAQPILAQVEQGRLLLSAPDSLSLWRADEDRLDQGRVAHYAAVHDVNVTPWDEDDAWELVDDQAFWSLRITSPGALSLSLAFERFRMPEGGELEIVSADGERVGPFTSEDNEAHGQLWTPPLVGDELTLELRVGVDQLDDLELRLRRIHHGYAGFGEPPPRSRECHRNVACSEAEEWADQSRSVALISVAGVRFCSGFLVNNTALDGRPLFMTAAHCGITEKNAPSVVVMWNFQTNTCDSKVAPTETQGGFQTGATLRAVHRPTDTTLIELDDAPSPELGVFYAGWDRSVTVPEQATVIHHPNTDVKRISFDFDPLTATKHLEDTASARANHLRIASWDLGSTEGGSSGAPLFNADRRVVGQLHGGWASCGNKRSDWFGRFAMAWQKLSRWLDPIGSDAVVLDGLDSLR